VTIFAPWLGKKEAAPLRLWAIRIWEADPPPDVEEPVEWMLITSLSIETLAEAAEAIGLYGFRWLIEEYHKCLKSGCAIEKKQLEEADRLEALLGIAAVVAVRLLAIKQQVKSRPQTPAVEHVEPMAVKVLCSWRKLKVKPQKLTLYEFWREVAKLGGFLGRCSDGEPGWQTLWLGWRELDLLTQGAKLARERWKRCG